MKTNPPLIIFATYWNERFFIEPSLRQIEVLNPCEIIICDGCFDPNVPNYSTDGTREIIQKFVETHPNAHMISALRPGFFQAAWMLLCGHKHLSWWTMLRPARWKFLIISLLAKSAYRRNQAITFNHMVSLSREWKPGMWFMTYDADQYYSDEMIETIHTTIRDSNSFDLIYGKEHTFFQSFDRYTLQYDSRGFSNMPHRVYADSLFQPTRSMIRETKSRGSTLSLKDMLARHLYIRFAKKLDAGFYFHYKLNPKERFEAGYQLGDRKKPDPKRYEVKRFTGKHPRVIRDYFHV